MSIFDLFRKNKNSDNDSNKSKDEKSERTISSSKVYADDGCKVTANTSIPNASKKVLGSTVRNGITYTTYEERFSDGSLSRYDVASYNDVLYYFTFLNKYPVIDKQEYVPEYFYSKWHFRSLDLPQISALHKELEDKGFYSPAKSDEILAELKVGEIKEIIAKLGLSIKGKKDELISQLVNQVNESTLSSTLNSKKYSISDYGWQWMSEHKEEYEYYTCNDEFKSFDEYQTYWKTHNKHDDAVSKCLIEIKADKEMFGRYEYDSLIALYKEEQNKEKEILECLLKELLIDLSGAMDFANWKDAHFDRETIEACSRIVFTPHLVKTLPKYKDFYSEKMLTDIYELKLPVNACSLNDFKNIVELMLDNALDQETREDYQKRLTKKLKEIGFARAK